MARRLARYETLYWIVRLGTFRAAAERLGVSQPTISLRIGEWERELGFRLFKRVGRSVVLSEDGAVVSDYADRILGLIHDLDQRIGVQDDFRGLVRLGIPDTFALMCLATMLRDLEQRYPNLSVAVTVDNSRVLASRLEEGALDIGVLAEPPNMRSMKTERLTAHQLTWVAAPGLIDNGGTYRPHDLMRQRILTNPAPSNTFTLIMDWFDEHGMVPPRTCYCNSIAVILYLVASGAGISAIPRGLARERLSEGEFVELNTEKPFPVQNFYIARRKSSTNQAVSAVSASIHEVVDAVTF